MKRSTSQYQQSLFLLSSIALSRFQRDAGAIVSIRVRVVVVLFFCSLFSFSQSKINSFLTPSDTLNSKRKTAVFVTEGVALGGTLIGLNQLWYSDYEKSSFHTLNDNNEWMQLDKAGHFFSTYHIGRVGADALAWSGATQKEQLLYGSTLGFGFLTVVEVFDGFSSEWGFSWGDMLANASGIGLYVTQDLLWNEQRITPKFSFHTTKYAELRPETLGKSFNEQILKDYNGQTYWLSVNLHSFAKQSKIPKWLNIAVGYGAEGMVYGTNSEAALNGIEQNPKHQFYLSFDIDLVKIPTESHFLKTVFSVFNTIKIPAPTLEINANSSVRGHFLYF